MPVLVTPHVAAEAGPRGIIPLDIEGETIAARVVGVVQRFPSIVGDAVVADLGQASTRLDTRSPGLGTTDELWLNSAAAPKTPELTVTSRAATLARSAVRPARPRRAADARRHSRGRAPARARRPRARPSSATCATTAASSSISRRRAHRPRRSARICGCAPRSSPRFGIVGGLILGAILSALVIDLVSVTASAAEPRAAAPAVARPAAARARGRRATSPPRRCSSAPRRCCAGARRRAPRRSRRERDRAARRLPGALDAGGRRSRTAGTVAARRRRRGARRAWPERLREVDAAPPPCRARPALGRHRPRARRGARQARAARPCALPLDDARLRRPALRARAGAGAHARASSSRCSWDCAARRRRERLRRADELLERVGLADKRERRPGRAVGRRAAARRALRGARAPATRVPGRRADRRARRARPPIRSTTSSAELVREHGCTTVLVSHDPESARIADRIVRIRDGRVSEEWARDGEDERHDRRRPRRLAAATGRAAAARRHRREGDGAVHRRRSRRRAERRHGPKRAGPGSRSESGPQRSGCAVVASAKDSTRATARRPSSRSSTSSCARGRLHAVTGPSGSGKTTLLHLLAGLELPDAGSVTVDGEAMSTPRPRRACCAPAREDRLRRPAGGARPASLRARERRARLSAPRRAGDAQRRARGSRGGRSRRAPDPACRRGSRRANGRASRSRARSPPGRPCSSPTSRRRASTAPTRSPCALLLARLARDTGAAVVCATHDPLVIEQADSTLSLSHLPLSGEVRRTP